MLRACLPPLPQGLVKNLLEVADNLERAAGSVPPADVADGADIDRDRALKLLRSLRDGVLMTDTVLMKVGGWGRWWGLRRWWAAGVVDGWVGCRAVASSAARLVRQQRCCCRACWRSSTCTCLPALVCCRLSALSPPPARPACAHAQVLASEGVSRYDPAGEEFDPNRHNALFEVPDATKPPRTVAVVVKVRGRTAAPGAEGPPCGGRGGPGVERLRTPAAALRRSTKAPRSRAHCCRTRLPAPSQRGYLLNERVVRAAEVGVTRAVDE